MAKSNNLNYNQTRFQHPTLPGHMADKILHSDKNYLQIVN